MAHRIFAFAALALAGCAQAPLTDQRILVTGATRGEIPRDGNGEPILNRVRPIPRTAIIPPGPAPKAP